MQVKNTLVFAIITDRLTDQISYKLHIGNIHKQIKPWIWIAADKFTFHPNGFLQTNQRTDGKKYEITSSRDALKLRSLQAL